MLPITLNFGDEIRGYEGIYFFLSFVVAVIMFVPRSRKIGINNDLLSSLIIFVVIFSLIGARLSHILFWEDDYFSRVNDLGDLLFSGGASITGGLIMGVFGAWLFAKWKRVPIGRLFDVGAPVTMMGLFVGRLGCFLNGDSHGTATTVPWGIPIPESGAQTLCVPGGMRDVPLSRTNICDGPEPTETAGHLFIEQKYWGLSVHPTQIYEALGALAIALIILLLFEKRGWLVNRRLWFVAFAYGLLRFMLEFVRSEFDSTNADALWTPNFINNAQWLTITMMVGGLAGMFFIKGGKDVIREGISPEEAKALQNQGKSKSGGGGGTASAKAKPKPKAKPKRR